MRVLVVDDNPVVRLGVRAVLEQVADVTEVLQAADGVQALEIALSERPDVVLLDVRMPRRGGIDVLPELAAIAPVLMLTHSDEPETIRAALAAGARGYLVHGALSIEEIEGAIRTCLAGGLVLGSEAATVMLARAEPPSGPHAGVRSRLTAREQQIMDSVAQGMGNAEIAAREFLSPKTVKNHLNSIYGKLQATSRAQAVAIWVGNRQWAQDGRSER